MKRNSLLLVILLCTVSFGTTRFLLESELRTDYNGSATNNFLTSYTYDTQGNRLLTRVWDGLDSINKTPISKCMISYTLNGLVAEELLLGQLGDTLSICRYAYKDSMPVLCKVLRKDGTLRYSDSLLYDVNKHQVEMRRYTSASAMTYYHRYSYNVSGQKVADTLYEQVNAPAYIPTQAVIFSYNTDGSVNSEASWRISGSQYYLIRTVKFGYSSLQLISATTYEGDGTSNVLMDSLAYAFDNFGNRTQEEEYDNARIKLHRIVYTWHDTQITAVGVSAAQNSLSLVPVTRERSIVFSRPFSGSAAIYGMNGKAIDARIMENAVRYDLPSSLGKGHYILSLACGNTVTGHQITIIK
jgi:hypothetical protein